MKALNTLKTPLAAQLIPSFKKTERRLLSVFMWVLDIVPEFRGEVLELVGYRGGKTSDYKSFMEPSSIYNASEIVRHPEAVSNGRKSLPNSISIVTSLQDIRRFKSRKKFIEDLESGAIDLVNLVSRLELI